jgi:hypothetical protein
MVSAKNRARKPLTESESGHDARLAKIMNIDTTRQPIESSLQALSISSTIIDRFNKNKHSSACGITKERHRMPANSMKIGCSKIQQYTYGGGGSHGACLFILRERFLIWATLRTGGAVTSK